MYDSRRDVAFLYKLFTPDAKGTGNKLSATWFIVDTINADIDMAYVWAGIE